LAARGEYRNQSTQSNVTYHHFGQDEAEVISSNARLVFEL
jgi:hypothetical protein